MKMANSAVSLQELGISDLRAGRAVIGALVFEVRGPEGSAKAAALAEKLAGLFAEREDVRVSARVQFLPPRPLQCFKCLEMGYVRHGCTTPENRTGACYR
ncbi:hypothetical protein ALC60_11850 [Trachymyrmex zeteki]|uniref:CCHC-type domain-containing protein n=1 Tax=Mycetomoellerius zeteki TaxID=64791 RepID=A0A151WMP3_9HYME|nr:hypothetical protein ALC60_11850 [Trachymyrmex zeteki]